MQARPSSSVVATFVPPVTLAVVAVIANPSVRAQTPVDFAALQFPASQSVAFGSPTTSIYGRVFKAGVTEAPGPAAGIAAQLGYGPDGSDPATSNAWQWYAASFNVQVGNDEEYVAVVPLPLPGVHDYAFRFAHNGSAFVHGDLDGSTNGYSPAQAGSLVVTGNGTPVDDASLVFPASLALPSGATSPQVFGRVFKIGVTEAAGPAPGIVAQFGFGPDGSNPDGNPAWVWIAAAFNLQVGNSDEYVASFTVPLPGVYDYAFRFAYAGSAWVTGDLDGSLNGYSPTQAGNLLATGVLPTQPSGCAGPVPLQLAVTGSTALGGAITSSISGLGGGVPFYTWNFGPPSQPLLPSCPCIVSSVAGWNFGFGSTIVIPNIPGLVGAQVLAQGLEVLPANGSCAVPVLLNLTEIATITIG